MANVSMGFTGDCNSGGVTLAEGSEWTSGFYLYGRMFDDVSAVQDLYASKEEPDPLSSARGILAGLTVSVFLWAFIVMLVALIREAFVR